GDEVALSGNLARGTTPRDGSSVPKAGLEAHLAGAGSEIAAAADCDRRAERGHDGAGEIPCAAFWIPRLTRKRSQLFRLSALLFQGTALVRIAVEQNEPARPARRVVKGHPVRSLATLYARAASGGRNA